MTIDQYQVDAFVDGPFTGNPAAVCILNEWLKDDLLQKIAEENNLSETSFLVPHGTDFHLRWFTPAIEVDLCGHATLASAFVLFNELGYEGEQIVFHSRSGALTVQKRGDLLEMDFPTDTISESDSSPLLEKGLGTKPVEVWTGRDDLICILQSQDEILGLTPDFRALNQLGGRGVLVTSEGKDPYDFVSRAFFPQSGIDEDPATGSAHTSLTPLWAKRFGKNEMTACQLSNRKGFFHCVFKGERTLISGRGNLFLKGQIFI